MSLISRIEISNYLTEGLDANHFADWSPMLTGITLRMDGLSSLINITNGGGKTSMAELLLYLLSRDKTLLMQLREKAAPNGRGYSHARIEFRTTDDSTFRAPQLLEVDVNNMSGSTHVIGVALNNDPAASPIFYGYSGTLEDSPCYRRENGALLAVPDSEFVKRTKSMPRCKWDTFANIREWHEHVGLFISMDVVRRNAIYQARGSDDKNASFFSFKPKNGESYDAAFFKSVVAPDLLTNLLNSFAEEGESTVEDTLHLSLSQIVNSEREIARKQANLELRQSAIEIDLKPVVDAGEKANTLQLAMQKALRAVKKDVALLHHFGSQKSPHAVPGLPRPVAGLARALDHDARITQALKGMVISREDGILIRDKTLSDLTGVEVRRLGEIADRKRIGATALNTQVIDFACDFGFSTSGAAGGGHYRKGYTEAAIGQLLPLLVDTQGATLDGLADVFKAAFQTAKGQIDTNPAALKLYGLEASLAANELELAALKIHTEELTAAIGGMEQQIKGREENEAAWQAFSNIAGNLPEDVRSTPKQALDWIVDRATEIQNELADMHRRNGELSRGWSEYLAALDYAGIEGIQGIRAQFDQLEKRSKEIQKNLKSDRSLVEALTKETPTLERALGKAQKLLTVCETTLARLNELKVSFTVFQGFFGEVDPTVIENPVVTAKRAALHKTQADETLRIAKFEWEGLVALKAGAARFTEIFGPNVDPFKCDPLTEHREWRDKAHLAQQEMQPLEPFVLALESFGLKFPTQTPEKWLQAADLSRTRLETEERESTQHLLGIRQEIDALDALALVDDASFAQAWALLGDGPVRLYSAIQGMPLPLATRIDALSALSGLLSAPVFASMAALEAASALLEKHGISIPMLLQDALASAIKSQGPAKGELRALGFIVGRHSRKVRILLEPEFAKSERAILVQKGDDLKARLEDIKGELLMVDFRSADYVLARDAAKAIQTDCVGRYQRHEKELADANAELARLAPQVKSDSLNVLRDRRSFLEKGGEEKQKSLWDYIELLGEQAIAISQALVEADRRATEESLRAYFAAREYVNSGADVAHESARKSVEQAKTELASATLVRDINQVDLKTAADNLTYSIAQAEDFQGKNGSIRLESLKSVLAFADNTDNLEFMQGFERQCTQCSQEASRLTSYQSTVNFERAEAYVANLGKSDIDLVKSIAAMKTEYNAADKTSKALTERNDIIRNYEVPNWLTLRKAVHDFAYELGSQASKTAKAHEEFKSLEEGAAPPEAHPLYKGLAHIVDQLRGITIEQTSALASLLGEKTFDLQELNPQEALETFNNSQRDFTAALGDYTTRKEAFCARAKQESNTQNSAFNLMELSAIESATPTNIVELLTLFDELTHSLNKDREDAAKAIQAAHNANEEALTQLASLIQVAEENLDALKRVMNRYQNGCFKIKVQLASGALIQEILLELKDRIKSATPLNGDAVRTMRRSDETRIKELLRVTLIDKVFLEPKVTFIHNGIRNKETPVTHKLSTGQKVALEFMWIVRQAEYEIERGLREMSSKQAAQARSKSNRAIFVDGIFSTLSDRRIIAEAFSGLGNLGGNFQIIGFLHSPTWTNDSSVFPVYHVGKKLVNSRGSSLVSFTEPGRKDGTLGFFTSIAQAPAHV